MGDMEQWLAQNWFDLLSSVGILFAVYTIHTDAKSRRVGNFLAITANYREIWKECLRNPGLARVLDASADVAGNPPTPTEELFVNLVISQMGSFYYAAKSDLVIKLEGSRKDMAQFLSLPIPKTVWIKARPLQNRDFVNFIDSATK
jgi:hypothetical protein